MREDLDKYGVTVVAISTDTPEQIEAGKDKHGLKGILLSDRDLTVTRQLNLENLKPMIKPPGLSGLPIPISILLNGDFEVCWFDQSKDYVDRSDASRVLAATEISLKPVQAAVNI